MCVWAHSILNTPGREAGCLRIGEMVYTLVAAEESPEPRPAIVLRRRPEEGVVRRTAPTATAVPVASRKSRKATAVGCACIW